MRELLAEWGSAFFGLSRYQLDAEVDSDANPVKAKATYEDFFALWKDADPDVLILNEAKAQYAKL